MNSKERKVYYSDRQTDMYYTKGEMKTLLKRIFGESETVNVPVAKQEQPFDTHLCNLSLFFAKDGEVFRTEKQKDDYEEGLIIKELADMLEIGRSTAPFGSMSYVTPRQLAKFLVKNLEKINCIVKG